MFKPNAYGELICQDFELVSIPKNLFNETDNISSIILCGNHITTIEGSSILKLTNLKILDLRANSLEVLSDQIGFLWNLKELRLDNNHLMSLPLQLFQLTSLEILTATRNSILAIPEIISKLRKLKNLSISYNQVKHLPSSIGKLSRLTELFIQNNLFTSIPVSVFSLNLNEFGLEWTDYLINDKSFLDLKQKLQTLPYKYIKFIDFLSLFAEKPDTVEILYRSIFKGEAGVVSALIEAEADVNCFDANGYSPLMIAVKNDKSTIARILIEAGASFKYGAGNYGSILHISVYKSEVWLVELVLSGGVDVNTIDAEGNTALHILMGIFSKQKHKNKRIGDLIMARNPKVNIKNYENWAPIHLAARKGYASALKWISKLNQTTLKDKEKFDVNIRGGSLDWVPLHLASHSNDFESISVLIDIGANVDIRNLEGKTAKSTCKGNLTVYKYLLRLEKIQRKLEVKKNKIEELGFGKRLACEYENEVYLQYRDVWDLYTVGKYEEMVDFLVKEKDSIAAVDALYLVSQNKEKHQVEFLDEAKRMKSSLGIIECKEADFKISMKCDVNKIYHEMIGPKSKKPQSSMFCNQALVHDEEI